MLENISLSFQGIWNHKIRSLLTMLGIIIGIASIITIVSTIKGTNDQIKQNLIGEGVNTVTVTFASTDSNTYVDMEDGSLSSKVKPIKEEAFEEMKNLAGIEDISAYTSRSWSNGTYYKNQTFEGSMYGIDDRYFAVNGYRLDYGRGFVADDFNLYRKVVIIDTNVMNNLFAGSNPIGEVIEISKEPFTVIGVVEKASGNNVVINNVEEYYTYMGNKTGSIFIPGTSWTSIYGFDEIKAFAIKASSTDDMAKAGKAAAAYLTENYVTDKSYEYKADNIMEQAAQLQALANSTNQQLVWIAGIALLVGGIGVMNIMLVSVTERTREIGLKKALGAKKRRILSQFLTEAATLTSLGGLLGVVVGIALAKLISSMTKTPSAISIPACLVAVIFSMAIGIIFGLIPAVKASKLNPIDALRRD